MLKHIKNFFPNLGDFNRRILWIESLLFSVIIGVSVHSWPVGCLILLGLSWILNKQKGPLYMVFIFSLIWSLAAMTIAYCFNGWGWGLTWGILSFAIGLTIHFRDLKRPLYEIRPVDDEMQCMPGLYLRRQNLN